MLRRALSSAPKFLASSCLQRRSARHVHTRGRWLALSRPCALVCVHWFSLDALSKLANSHDGQQLVMHCCTNTSIGKDGSTNMAAVLTHTQNLSHALTPRLPRSNQHNPTPHTALLQSRFRQPAGLHRPSCRKSSNKLRTLQSPPRPGPRWQAQPKSEQ